MKINEFTSETTTTIEDGIWRLDIEKRSSGQISVNLGQQFAWKHQKDDYIHYLSRDEFLPLVDVILKAYELITGKGPESPTSKCRGGVMCGAPGEPCLCKGE